LMPMSESSVERQRAARGIERSAQVEEPDRVAPFVTVVADADVAVLRLDDGKVNAFSRRSIAALHAALDDVADARAVVVCGRAGLLSAGLDLAEVRADPVTQRELSADFMRLMLRIFTSEAPIVVGCTGHALAGGAALLIAADRRIGTAGAYKLGFNEVAAGVALSPAAMELTRYGLAMPWYETTVSGTVFDPAGALVVGLLDEVVDDALPVAIAAAKALGSLDRHAFATTKHFARRHAARAITDALDRSAARAQTPSAS
jgi:enoyl-CoA hydratase